MKKMLCVLVMMMMVLSGCGSSFSDSTASTSSSMSEMAMEEAVVMDMEMGVATSGGGINTMETTKSAKFIYTADLQMETTSFAETIAAFGELVEEMDGYFQNSSVRNQGSYRYGDYVVRLPQENLVAFTEQAGELSLVTHSSSSAEEISFQYYDTQSRLETQEIKLERLQVLLQQADIMEDIITIESAISETEQYIDSLSGTMTQYDSMVDYATVYVNIQEVNKLSNVEETPIGFGGRLANAFTGGLGNVVDTCEDLAVFVAYNWIGILIVFGVVFVVYRKANKGAKKILAMRKKNEGTKQNEEE
ncbi:DUF4349 domain-containing protein [Chakrabartyella piscis]|uniref:DUF4349 domain-containing protein n=1 Tax=Chakrabartyella piscis TaxID=2918914 RepID=UPI0029589E82|nr:DUF4349 domain-containing protein [Chakrabartyella piscis]